MYKSVALFDYVINIVVFFSPTYTVPWRFTPRHVNFDPRSSLADPVSFTFPFVHSWLAGLNSNTDSISFHN